MIRWSVLAAGAVVALAGAFVTGASVPPKAATPVEAKAEVAKPPVVVGQKTGYFNMVKVMRDYKRARTAAERLGARKDRLSANLVGLRNMHTELQEIAKLTTNAKRKDEIAEDLIQLKRQIEDLDRELTKILNDKASIVLSELYDELRAATEQVARDHGLVALIAYPDAVTAEETESPTIRELKLKPPAAYPFYLDSSVDYTDEIIRKVNEKFNAENN